MTREKYNPISFDVEASHKRWMKRPGYAEAYAALADEFAALAELVRARQHAAMTQADVADRMDVAAGNFSR